MEKVLFFLLFVIVALFPVLVVSSCQEAREWERFKVAHNCKVVGKMDGSVGTTVGPTFGANGKVGTGVGITSIPGKTGWQCDDGVTYWKND